MSKYYVYIGVALILLCSACANRGQGPQGGPRDTIPPMVLKELPVNGTLAFTNQKVEITFDEYIQLDNVQNNVLISPPQQNPPEVKAFGKTLSVVFQEELQDSTTYTIDFGAAICDYNEKTPLEGYVYAFSTGDYIDSLAISGCVYNAENLNPMPTVLVGIHRNMADSALSTLPFSRITRADSEGNFTIHNIHPGTYRLYALNDISRDYLYQPGEALAFVDSTIQPYMQMEHHQDTIWQDTLGIDLVTGDTLFTRLIDSVYTHEVARYLPDSLVLWYFEESKQRLYFQKIMREEQHAFTMLFSAPQPSMPIVRSLSPSQMDSTASDSSYVDWMQYMLLQHSPTYDTITYWLTDSLAIAMDSIYFEVTYQVTDSLYNIVPQTDTLLAVYRHPRLSEKAREAYLRGKRERKLALTTNASTKFEIYDTLRVQSDFPLDSIHTEMFHLMHKVDTIFKDIPFQLAKVDSLGMLIHLLAELKPMESYLLRIDSAACCDIYGKCNELIEDNIKLKSLDEYSSLKVKMTHFDPRARIQLLNDKDKVVAEKPAMQDGTLFDYLAPTTFYLRLYIDYSGDGKWTTGDWLSKRQPEPIYYYPNRLKLRANWDFEENFDHLAIPQILSKPEALKKKKKDN